MSKYLCFAFLGVLLLSACGGGDAGKAGVSTLVSVSTATESQCPIGGSQVAIGADSNRNNVLDAEEITTSWPVCSGSVGASGSIGGNSLIYTEATVPDETCPFGGTLVVVGIDADGSGLLEVAERDAATAQTFCANATSQFDGLVFLAPVYVAASQALYKVNADGSALVRLAATTHAAQSLQSFKVSPDHTRVAFSAKMEATSPYDLYVVSLIAAEPVVKVTGVVAAGRAGLVSTSQFWWSPDSTHLAYVADTESVNPNDQELYVVAADGSGRVRLDGGTNPTGDVNGVAWSPDSRWLAFFGSQREVSTSYYYSVYIVPVDNSTGAVAVDGIGSYARDAGTLLAWSPNPSPLTLAVFAREADGKLRVYRAGPASPASPGTGVGDALDYVTSVAWEPTQGRVLAFSGRPEGSLNEKLYTMRDFDATTMGTVIATAGSIRAFAWSPSGNSIAYYDSTFGGIPDLKVVAPLVANATPITVAGGVSSSGWAPVGDRLAYVNAANVNVGELYTFSVASGASLQISSLVETIGEIWTWSPDGQRLAYTRAADADQCGSSVYVQAAAGGTPVEIGASVDAECAGVPRWSRNGATLAYVVDPIGDVPFQLYLSPATGGAVVPVLPDSRAGNLIDNLVWDAAFTP